MLRRANLAAAFTGVTRQRVISLLDHIGAHHGLGLGTSADLLGEAGDLLQVRPCFIFPCSGVSFRRNSAKAPCVLGPPQQTARSRSRAQIKGKFKRRR